jgi:predicted outer membrane protein
LKEPVRAFALAVVAFGAADVELAHRALETSANAHNRAFVRTDNTTS